MLPLDLHFTSHCRPSLSPPRPSSWSPQIRFNATVKPTLPVSLFLTHSRKPLIASHHRCSSAAAAHHRCTLLHMLKDEELKGVLHTVPEIVELVGATNTNLVLQTNDQDGEEKVKGILRAVLTDLMSASKERVTDAVNRLKSLFMLL